MEDKPGEMKKVPLPDWLAYLNEEELGELKGLFAKNNIISSDKELDVHMKHIERMIGKSESDRKGSKNFWCLVCGKNEKTGQKIKNHVEANHVKGVQHKCRKCSLLSVSNASLLHHMANQHV